jgi:hypothetical protein
MRTSLSLIQRDDHPRWLPPLNEDDPLRSWDDPNRAISLATGDRLVPPGAEPAPTSD